MYNQLHTHCKTESKILKGDVVTDTLGSHTINVKRYIKNRGLALLNRQRIFGPLSSVTLALVGNSEHTYHHRSHKFVILNVYYQNSIYN